MFVIFLSNRVHPDGKGDVAALRGRVASIAGGAVTDLAVALKARLQLSHYYESVTRDIVHFTALQDQAAAWSGTADNLAAGPKVLTGIDVLERDGFKQLAGKKIGLVTKRPVSARLVWPYRVHGHLGLDRFGD